jgi:hypothetical protein
MYERLALDHQPELQFVNRTAADFAAWKAEALPRVIATLQDFPPRVAPNPQLMAEWTHDGLRKQRWLLDAGQHISASLLINYPTTPEPRPAILCWHGHGDHGKEPVMGNDGSVAMRADIERFNYNYGHQMAKEGYVTFAIDWLGAGERNDGQMHNGARSSHNRDWCNILYLHATMLGMTSISINVQHGRVATDFVLGLPEVAGENIGVMGLSGGGTMALWSSLCDERVAATEIICYSQLWEHFGLRDTNYCGMQVAPGLYKLVDLPDLQGLIAPRPLLVDIGAYDSCFVVDGAMACFHQVENIYEAAGARDNLELDLFPREHGWGGNKSAAFFGKHLK